MSTINERIIPLDELDAFEVAEGDPDVRGWQVYGGDGVRVGVVDELLVDTEAMKVRYLDVELADGDDGREERHVLIPIGFGRLHETDDIILVDGLDSAGLVQLPEYTQEPLTRELERAVLSRFVPADRAREPADDPYGNEGYDEERFYGPRRAYGDG